MDDRYDSYCAVDPLFYDSLSTGASTAARYAADRPLPDGWEREVKDDWLVYGPIGGTLPQQGWKLHVSARLDNAERVLARVLDYCQPRGIPVKHLRGPQLLLMRNSKYARRGSSGKFITVYPRDDAELELTAKELADLLDGEPGPYVLSDLRYGAGPVHLRYGGFAARYCLSPDGQVVPAIEDQHGQLVPDRRDPVFYVPEWVTLPDFLAPHLAARNATTTGDLPYRIEKVIHFSNGGGLYEGRDTRTGERVVLKEARPHAGLDSTGTDAVTRLRREAEMLTLLADVPHLVRVHDRFTLGEHEFLALSYVDAQPLNRLVVERHPLVHLDADRAAYTRWALDVHRQVAEAVAAIHAHGVVYGDLHMFNILVGDDGTVTLVDFEVAAPVADATRPALRNQAFAAPRDRTGVDVDRYALACLRIALFMPLTAMLRLAPGKAAHMADVVTEHFPVPRALLDEAVAVIDGPGGSAWTVERSAQDCTRIDPDDWPGLRDRLAAAIAASATPQRDDRLFPGDIQQFSGADGGLNVAHGAAGVLWALHATGAAVDPEHERWLVDRVRKPASGTRLGFYDGLHGIAYVLDRLGRRDEALRLLDTCLAEPWQSLGPDLVSGLSGIALNLAHFADTAGDSRYLDAAREAAGLVTARRWLSRSAGGTSLVMTPRTRAPSARRSSPGVRRPVSRTTTQCGTALCRRPVSAGRSSSTSRSARTRSTARSPASPGTSPDGSLSATTSKSGAASSTDTRTPRSRPGSPTTATRTADRPPASGRPGSRPKSESALVAMALLGRTRPGCRTTAGEQPARRRPARVDI
jgi:serine/threonine protein kinase